MQLWRRRNIWKWVAAMLVLTGFDSPRGFAQVSTDHSAATPSATNAPLTLPIVARPSAIQPVIGDPYDAYLDRTPPRRTKGLDLVKMGWSYNCMQCHKLLPAKWHYDRPMAEHETIHLDHGNNRFCLNCHHATNRNAFADYDGSEIAEQDVVQLCAKCHGPIYRDWKAGVHGRRNGFWNKEKGVQTQLRCIQCHDPHQPKFQAMKPMAPLHYPERAAGAISAKQAARGTAEEHP